MQTIESSQKHHVHWLIALIVFLETVIFGGIINSFVIYTVPIAEDLSVGYGALSIGNLPYSIVSFLSSLAVGALFQRFGYRKVALTSLLISAAGMALMSASRNLFVYGISRAIFGMGFGACFTAGAVLIIKNWFNRHQGLILGIVTMASGIGGSLMTWILTRITVANGWRTAALFSGVLLAMIAIPYLFIRNHPAEMGLAQFGKNDTQSTVTTKSTWVGLPGQIILRRPLFYLTCLAVTLCCISVYVTSTTIVPYFRDAGYSAIAASGYNSTMMLAVAIAKVSAGWFSDRFGAKRVTFLCLICTALGRFMLTAVSSPLLSHISTGIFSVGLCMSSICIPLMTVPLFGTQGSLKVNSYILAMPSLAMIIAPPLVNFARDHFGSYTPAYHMAFIGDIVVIVLFSILFALAKKDRKRYAE